MGTRAADNAITRAFGAAELLGAQGRLGTAVVRLEQAWGKHGAQASPDVGREYVRRFAQAALEAEDGVAACRVLEAQWPKVAEGEAPVWMPRVRGLALAMAGRPAEAALEAGAADDRGVRTERARQALRAGEPQAAAALVEGIATPAAILVRHDAAAVTEGGPGQEERTRESAAALAEAKAGWMDWEALGWRWLAGAEPGRWQIDGATTTGHGWRKEVLDRLHAFMERHEAECPDGRAWTALTVDAADLLVRTGVGDPESIGRLLATLDGSRAIDPAVACRRGCIEALRTSGEGKDAEKALQAWKTLERTEAALGRQRERRRASAWSWGNHARLRWRSGLGESAEAVATIGGDVAERFGALGLAEWEARSMEEAASLAGIAGDGTEALAQVRRAQRPHGKLAWRHLGRLVVRESSLLSMVEEAFEEAFLRAIEPKAKALEGRIDAETMAALYYPRAHHRARSGRVAEAMAGMRGGLLEQGAGRTPRARKLLEWGVAERTVIDGLQHGHWRQVLEAVDALLAPGGDAWEQAVVHGMRGEAWTEGGDLGEAARHYRAMAGAASARTGEGDWFEASDLRELWLDAQVGLLRTEMTSGQWEEAASRLDEEILPMVERTPGWRGRAHLEPMVRACREAVARGATAPRTRH